MKIEKTKNASRNIIFGVLLKIYQILLPFIIRTVMMYTIGVEYLGLNSLFTSVLQVLNLAELGVGSAMVFSMYKPIAEDDSLTICALMKLYKIYYRVIGGIILIIGLGLTPFIPKLISGNIPTDMNVYILYLLNLFATVLTYWLFAYRNSILQAHQRNDVASKVTLGTETIKYILQIAALVLFHNYYYFVIVLLFTQILNNLFTAVAAKKIFPQYNPEGRLPKEEIRQINGKIRDLFTSKLGYTIVSSADTIVISAFLGLTALAQYQNYYYIMSSIIGFMSIIYASITAGVGNSMLTKSIDQNYEEFRIFTLLVSFVNGICCACFMGLYQPFMKLWMGENLLLPFSLVVLLCVYFWIYEYIMMASVYKDAGGIWHQDRFRPLISGVLNLGFNLFTVKFIGLYGIVLSTIVSMAIVSAPWITTNIFKLIFKRNPIKYVSKLCYYAFSAVVASFLSYNAVNLISVDGWIGLILKALVCVIISSVIMLLLFFKMDEFAGAVSLVKRMFHLKNKQSK